jgi:phage gp36-like protein
MPYCTVEDVMIAFPKIKTSGFDSTMIQARIEDADAEIDAMLAHAYTVPFATDPENTPRMIRMLSKILSVCDVFDRAPTTPEWLTTRCARARELLDKLATGEIILPEVPGLDGSMMVTVSKNYVPVFGKIPSMNEREDPNLVNREERERGGVGIFTSDDDFFN